MEEKGRTRKTEKDTMIKTALGKFHAATTRVIEDDRTNPVITAFLSAQVAEAGSRLAQLRQ